VYVKRRSPTTTKAERQELIDVQGLQNLEVLCQMATEREALLRRSVIPAGHRNARRLVRRWLGQRLMSIGARVAADPAPQPALAR
jgi:hypothetical protein